MMRLLPCALGALPDVTLLHRRALLASLVVACACATAPPRVAPPALVDASEIAVYRTVVDSFYARGAGGRAIAVVMETLDTACAGTTCPPIAERWGFDSLFVATESRGVADSLAVSLMAQLGRPRAIGSPGLGSARLLPVALSDVPAAGADSATWRAFQSAHYAAAVLRFSPIGFAQNRTHALVVVRMTCGPGCGHWLRAILVGRGAGWAIGDVLLISSDRR